jgi:large subunit ribosomal protein L15
LPGKRGFTNIFRTEYAIVNLEKLNIFDQESEITPQKLVDYGLVSSLRKPIKILGSGELQRPLVVKANKFSQAAKKKIEAAGGRAEEI